MVLTLVGAAVLLSALSGLYIDVLWFREVGFSSVFWGRVWAQLALASTFGVAFFVLLYVNLLIVRAIRPPYQVMGVGQDYAERYRVAFEPHARWATPAVAVVFAVFAAVGVAGQWQAFQLWRAAADVPFNVIDPVFGHDLSRYVLSLPFQRFIQSWLFSSLVVVLLVTAGASYLWGGIRPASPTQRVVPQVKAHLSVLMGLIVLVKAWGYRLEQYDLLLSPRGTVTGASYTDINARLPALKLLVVIAVVTAVLFLVNIRFRGWALPALGLGLLALTSVAAGTLYPAAIQRFRVDPQELQQERPYIERNLEFSRRAFGIDDIDERSFPVERGIDQQDVDQNQETVENIRLWNPEVLKQSFVNLQRIRPYYDFPDVDVDRYEVNGDRRTVMVAAREIAQSGIAQGGTWQNRHLFYTHGFGMVATRVDEVSVEGAPSFVMSDIPVKGDLADRLDNPRLYFSEKTDVPFVITGTETPEFDFPQSAEGETRFARTTYEGLGGIEVGGFFRKLVLAWRFRDVNMLLSDLINADSRILINRDLQTRVQKVAPFLQYDHDPYAAMVDGRVVWIWDAYTTTDMYPYSQRANLADLTDNDLQGQANYIRNSVKVVIDAYDGTTRFFLMDPEDPLILAWQRVFPDLFTPLSEASDDLRAHFRYPEDLFRVQAWQYTAYHVTEPDQFYHREDFWSLPLLPEQTGGEQDQDQQLPSSQLEPYYVLMPLPGEDEARFVLFIPFTPANRPNMVAWMAAISDPEDYGQLVSIEFPGRNVEGPEQIAALIVADPDVSRDVSLFSQRGSRVIFGDLLAIPVGDSFLYVQPLYLRSQQTESAIPELKRVIVAHGGSVTMAPTLQEALAQSLGVEEPEEPEEPDPDEPDPDEPDPDAPPEGTIEQLLAEAEEHFLEADRLLREGDLAGYQREIGLAREAVQEAARQAAAG